MEKSKIFFLIIIIILLLIIGFLIYGEFNNNDKQIKVGNAKFDLPEGYSVSGLNSAGDLKITKNNDSIYFKEYKGNNSKTYVDNYIKDREKANESVSSSQFKINNISIYKATNENSSSNHYWFSNKGKVYTIYSWDETENIDDIVSKLIKSMK